MRESREWSPRFFESNRSKFPGLRRELGNRPVVFLDGPAGTQVPHTVIDAMGRYLQTCNANHGGLFATSEESDAWTDAAHEAAADFLGSDDAQTVYFGPNMTTLTLALSRSLAKTWRRGDEIILTRLEHDANFTPWVLAAADAGATVRYVDICPTDCTLQLQQLLDFLNPRTRLVAVGSASNATGTVNPIRTISAAAQDVGALTFVDAVHFAPHDLLDVQQLGCDFLVCSAYKFFGPHAGMMWGRRQLLESLEPYKLRPAPDDLPGRWMTGTQSHEAIVGTLAAIDYLAELGRSVSDQRQLPRREALKHAWRAIRAYEMQLTDTLLRGLQSIRGVKIWGICDPDRALERLPTVSFTHDRATPAQIARALGDRGIFTWHGNYYALPLTEALGLEPEGMVRVGLVHYNTQGEVERLIDGLQQFLV